MTQRPCNLISTVLIHSPEGPLDPCPPSGVVDECEELSVVVDVEVAVVRHRQPEPHSQTGLSHPLRIPDGLLRAELEDLVQDDVVQVQCKRYFR